MFERIEIFDKRYAELNRRLYEPDVAANPDEYQKVMKEIKSIEEIVLTYRDYKAAQQTERDSLEILNDNSDSELKELAQLELDEAKETIERLSEQLKILLLPKDPNDERNVIVEIRGGAGGEESALFSAVLFRMYSMYAEKRGYKIEIINANETELGGYKEISFMINGEGAYSRFKYESGVHRVQRVPETESQGRVHTSTTRRRRSAHQQDQLRYSHHASAHGHGGGVSGRAQPIQEQGQGAQGAQKPSAKGEAGRAGE